MALLMHVFAKSKEELDKSVEKIHNSLVGSPAYINSEIAIVEGDSEDEYIICIGEDNSNNIDIKVNLNDVFTKKVRVAVEETKCKIFELDLPTDQSKWNDIISEAYKKGKFDLSEEPVNNALYATEEPGELVSEWNEIILDNNDPYGFVNQVDEYSSFLKSPIGQMIKDL